MFGLDEEIGSTAGYSSSVPFSLMPCSAQSWDQNSAPTE